MLKLESKKVTLPLYLCVLTALITPPLAQAELGGSGGLAASQAAEQRAAQEKKRAEKKRKAEEGKKSSESQPAETQTPAEGQQEKPADQ